MVFSGAPLYLSFSQSVRRCPRQWHHPRLTDSGADFSTGKMGRHTGPGVLDTESVRRCPRQWHHPRLTDSGADFSIGKMEKETGPGCFGTLRFVWMVKRDKKLACVEKRDFSGCSESSTQSFLRLK
ncbi:hypothetical protein CDAR_435661 [Caerostris darwini]|uniref:Uncharacterized protein n=1 Tax=Caerostris darwini TaxID=1538125 RepID=A0AAV4P9D8_9ARAC|nr:hypothetical protein CDAR_435661 [Caerostris darwini]